MNTDYQQGSEEECSFSMKSCDLTETPVGEELQAGQINESNINCYAELVFIPDKENF
jgi:hypothetical protein